MTTVEEFFSGEEEKIDLEATKDQIELLLSVGSNAISSEDFIGAENYFKDALIIAEEYFEPNSDLVLKCRNCLAVAYSEQGNYDKSMVIKEEILKARQSNDGVASPEALGAMMNLAVDYAGKRWFFKAGALDKEAYDLCLSTYGYDDPIIIMLINSLADDYIFQSRHDKALELMEEALEPAKNLFVAGKISFDENMQMGLRLAQCQEIVTAHSDYFDLNENSREYAYACAELLDLFKGYDEGTISKVPRNFMNFLEQRSSLVPNYEPHLAGRSLHDCDMLPLSRSLLGTVCTYYWNNEYFSEIMAGEGLYFSVRVVEALADGEFTVLFKVAPHEESDYFDDDTAFGEYTFATKSTVHKSLFLFGVEDKGDGSFELDLLFKGDGGTLIAAMYNRNDNTLTI